jgi:hypothetical protein
MRFQLITGVIMTQVQRFVSSKQILKTLTDNPDLPAFIPTVPAVGMISLIDRIGVEDSAMLIEFTTPNQLAEILDEITWTNPVPGAPEKFDSVEFFRWLEVILELGDDFVVERLQALDEDFLVHILSHYIQASDLNTEINDREFFKDNTIPGSSSSECMELVGRFHISPIHDEEWYVLHPVLWALQEQQPNLLQAVLTRCVATESAMYGLSNTCVALDTAHRQKLKKQQKGFVAPEEAARFLDSARDSSLSLILQEDDYDLDAEAHFRRAMSDKTPLPADLDGILSVHELVDTNNLELLAAVVGRVELEKSHDSVQLLTGPQDELNALQKRLQALAEADPTAMAHRKAEISYLSNILMAACLIDGEKFNDKQAVDAVHATCNVGLEYYPSYSIADKPGLIGLFRIGWHVVQKLPQHVLIKLANVLRSTSTQAQLKHRAWLVNDILRVFSREQIIVDVELKRFDSIHDNLQMLSLVMDEPTCVHLQLLVDHCPRTLKEISGQRVSVSGKFIEGKHDFESIDIFLDELSHKLKM